MLILVLNCGSSSVKYQVIDMADERRLAWGQVERIGADDAVLHHWRAGAEGEVRQTGTVLEHRAAVRLLLGALTHPEHGAVADLSAIAAVGHRIVHGGERFQASVAVSPEVKAELRRLFDLAPLHNPPNLAGIEAAEALLPGVPQVAVFDTAFHATLSRTAYLYALPYVLYKRYGIRRYGFHGTSHLWVTQRMAALTGRDDLRLISCHLGSGASVCAVDGGRSVDTSMGFTPTEGLIMNTRCGDLDPGIVPFIMAREDLSLAEINSLLTKHSGLRGISAVSGDMREIEIEMQGGDPRCREAFDIFCYRLRKYIGAYAAALGGVDAIAFTGGIGENSWRVRQAVCAPLGFLGVSLDEAVNAGTPGEALISRPDAPVQVWTVPTNEELVIARDTLVLVRAAAAGGN